MAATFLNVDMRSTHGCREESLRQVSKRKGVLLTTYGMVLHNSASLKLQQHGASDDNGRCWDFMILDEVKHTVSVDSAQLQWHLSES